MHIQTQLQVLHKRVVHDCMCDQDPLVDSYLYFCILYTMLLYITVHYKV